MQVRSDNNFRVENDRTGDYAYIHGMRLKIYQNVAAILFRVFSSAAGMLVARMVSFVDLE